MSAKKILVLSNMYPTEKAKSFGIFVKNQVDALREKGLEVDVIAVTNPSMKKQDVIAKYLFWMLRVMLHLILKGRSYDVVHVHYVFPTGMLGLLYKKLWKTRLIVTAHGGDIDRMAQKSGRIRHWTKRILEEADHVIAVGQKLYENIHEHFNIPKEKISIINMGVNRKVFAPMDKSAARKKCGIDEQSIPILFVGNMIKQKGLLELIEAFSMLKREIPNVSLYLIGAKKDFTFYNELVEYVHRRTLQDVFIYDAMPQSEIAVWMSAAEVFVLPSHLEGFGLVALEAMSCHTPVVGSDVGGLSYLLADGAGVLVEPHNPQSLYEGIKKVITDSNIGKQLIQKGEIRAQENDQQYLIEKVIQVYSPPEGMSNA
ncbi:glycosyltransferase involved in cell wall biosynthesis [Anoxybacillus vitaminiphilus]|uniref:Glycosyltransferase involved in cell wall biosynthesis n=1 Tax=Paranoxybacillus vitaminiphilus TaxID=581036 RepID=A0A327YG89_9BACL|nr:glycosyltransferase [Anoxybacillus vitaminiphilus]RAK19904.1 glycosyltransferase involved in cell wall biosynthesis [Anoxybacillus vitaminiphilus]